MPALHLFEYATIRLVPRVEREEFINAGVVLYCREQQFLNCRWLLSEVRLLALVGPITAQHLVLPELQLRLLAFEHICAGGISSGPIGRLGLAERFRWLTAQRSTIVQCSAVHPGLCQDAATTLEQLFQQLVQ